ncbi:CRISPR-associated protein Csd1 [Ruminococcus sp. YE71]|uniref:type I-C CRISPR-associated protein Cas8c/Csd1 n=1 Tax=unclassified Ruminococcus TaxID=2608920 RepID=UPI0008878C7B|nr:MULTISPECIES: type I-C CRISPR-associated protein Cas8c/Csd1 [unclassified Ruminococcus]SDA13169.1 CRISPR-associated protein Csd1 [Ruminococcus sp. YE78]SFW18583.1 CRISPR-associated protein Csd1 [Ruminococcus sp. YE71]
MSWTNELYKVYELAVGTEAAEGETPLLPISHSTANAQIEITIDENGEFVSAAVVNKEDAVTIIPVTEDSGTRSSGIAPMPLADKLVYIAGDYPLYAKGKRSDNSEYYSAYMEQLEKWCESTHSHPAVKAVYDYLLKKELMADLVKSGVIILDENTNKFSEKVKYANISQEDSFVRFIVLSENDVCRTWLDKSLYDSFIDFYSCRDANTELCYITGEQDKVTYKLPNKIRNSGDKAKLISSNDDSGFTYRGRFANKEQALSVGYEFSQKMHNALKWLIGRQGMYFDTLTLVTWQSSLAELPSVTKSAWDLDDDEEQKEDYDPKRYFSERLAALMLGYKKKFNDGDKVMVMGLDAATTGRLSVAIYTELDGSVFLDNLQKWHEQTAWLRLNSKKKHSEVNSFGFYDIANCAFGTEQSGKLECDKKLLRDTVLRLLPCTVEGKRLPSDIVTALCNRASKPLDYEQKYNHDRIVETACGMIRKAQLDSGNNKKYYKGEITMAYDPNCTDRSYLFGCLLAIADKAESDTYGKDEKRITNARRYWSAFSSRPYQTWQTIEEKLEPYFEKDKGVMVRYTKHLNEIMGKMSLDDFKDNTKLSPMYLIGFHHYNALLWAGKSNNDEENEEE